MSLSLAANWVVKIVDNVKFVVGLASNGTLETVPMHCLKYIKDFNPTSFHSYPDISSKILFSETTPKMYLGKPDGIEVEINFMHKLFVYGDNGMFSVFSSAPTFYHDQPLISGTPIFNSKGQLASVITASKDSHYAVCNYSSDNFSLSAQIVLTSDKSKSIAWGDKEFNNKFDAFNNKPNDGIYIWNKSTGQKQIQLFLNEKLIFNFHPVAVAADTYHATRNKISAKNVDNLIKSKSKIDVAKANVQCVEANVRQLKKDLDDAVKQLEQVKLECKVPAQPITNAKRARAQAKKQAAKKKTALEKTSDAIKNVLLVGLVLLSFVALSSATPTTTPVVPVIPDAGAKPSSKTNVPTSTDKSSIVDNNVVNTDAEPMVYIEKACLKLNEYTKLTGIKVPSFDFQINIENAYTKIVAHIDKKFSKSAKEQVVLDYIPVLRILAHCHNNHPSESVFDNVISVYHAINHYHQLAKVVDELGGNCTQEITTDNVHAAIQLCKTERDQLMIHQHKKEKLLGSMLITCTSNVGTYLSFGGIPCTSGVTGPKMLDHLDGICRHLGSGFTPIGQNCRLPNGIKSNGMLSTPSALNISNGKSCTLGCFAKDLLFTLFTDQPLCVPCITPFSSIFWEKGCFGESNLKEPITIASIRIFSELTSFVINNQVKNCSNIYSFSSCCRNKGPASVNVANTIVDKYCICPSKQTILNKTASTFASHFHRLLTSYHVAWFLVLAILSYFLPQFSRLIFIFFFISLILGTYADCTVESLNPTFKSDLKDHDFMRTHLVVGQCLDFNGVAVEVLDVRTVVEYTFFRAYPWNLKPVCQFLNWGCEYGQSDRVYTMESDCYKNCNTGIRVYKTERVPDFQGSGCVFADNAYVRGDACFSAGALGNQVYLFKKFSSTPKLCLKLRFHYAQSTEIFETCTNEHSRLDISDVNVGEQFVPTAISIRKNIISCSFQDLSISSACNSADYMEPTNIDTACLGVGFSWNSIHHEYDISWNKNDFQETMDDQFVLCPDNSNVTTDTTTVHYALSTDKATASLSTKQLVKMSMRQCSGISTEKFLVQPGLNGFHKTTIVSVLSNHQTSDCYLKLYLEGCLSLSGNYFLLKKNAPSSRLEFWCWSNATNNLIIEMKGKTDTQTVSVLKNYQPHMNSIKNYLSSSQMEFSLQDSLNTIFSNIINFDFMGYFHAFLSFFNWNFLKIGAVILFSFMFYKSFVMGHFINAAVMLLIVLLIWKNPLSAALTLQDAAFASGQFVGIINNSVTQALTFNFFMDPMHSLFCFEQFLIILVAILIMMFHPYFCCGLIFSFLPLSLTFLKSCLNNSSVVNRDIYHPNVFAIVAFFFGVGDVRTRPLENDPLFGNDFTLLQKLQNWFKSNFYSRHASFIPIDITIVDLSYLNHETANKPGHYVAYLPSGHRFEFYRSPVKGITFFFSSHYFKNPFNDNNKGLAYQYDVDNTDYELIKLNEKLLVSGMSGHVEVTGSDVEMYAGRGFFNGAIWEQIRYVKIEDEQLHGNLKVKFALLNPDLVLKQIDECKVLEEQLIHNGNGTIIADQGIRDRDLTFKNEINDDLAYANDALFPGYYQYVDPTIFTNQGCVASKIPETDDFVWQITENCQRYCRTFNMLASHSVPKEEGLYLQAPDVYVKQLIPISVCPNNVYVYFGPDNNKQWHSYEVIRDFMYLDELPLESRTKLRDHLSFDEWTDKLLDSVDSVGLEKVSKIKMEIEELFKVLESELLSSAAKEDLIEEFRTKIDKVLFRNPFEVKTQIKTKLMEKINKSIEKVESTDHRTGIFYKTCVFQEDASITSGTPIYGTRTTCAKTNPISCITKSVIYQGKRYYVVSMASDEYFSSWIDRAGVTVTEGTNVVPMNHHKTLFSPVKEIKLVHSFGKMFAQGYDNKVNEPSILFKCTGFSKNVTYHNEIIDTTPESMRLTKCPYDETKYINVSSLNLDEITTDDVHLCAVEKAQYRAGKIPMDDINWREVSSIQDSLHKAAYLHELMPASIEDGLYQYARTSLHMYKRNGLVVSFNVLRNTVEQIDLPLTRNPICQQILLKLPLYTGKKNLILHKSFTSLASDKSTNHSLKEFQDNLVIDAAGMCFLALDKHEAIMNAVFKSMQADKFFEDPFENAKIQDLEVEKNSKFVGDNALVEESVKPYTLPVTHNKNAFATPDIRVNVRVGVKQQYCKMLNSTNINLDMVVFDADVFANVVHHIFNMGHKRIGINYQCKEKTPKVEIPCVLANAINHVLIIENGTKAAIECNPFIEFFPTTSDSNVINSIIVEVNEDLSQAWDDVIAMPASIDNSVHFKRGENVATIAETGLDENDFHVGSLINMTSIGSYCMSEGTLISNYHCTNGLNVLLSRNGKTFEMSPTMQNKQSDVIMYNRTDFKFQEVINGEIVITFNPVANWGCYLRYEETSIYASRQNSKFRRFVPVTRIGNTYSIKPTISFPGMSGSPIVNSAGKLVGIYGLVDNTTSTGGMIHDTVLSSANQNLQAVRDNYQIAAENCWSKPIDENQWYYIEQPTGTGKTLFFSQHLLMLADNQKTILLLQPNVSAVNNTFNRLSALISNANMAHQICIEKHVGNQNDRPDEYHGTFVKSRIQILTYGKFLAGRWFTRTIPDVVICDEIHSRHDSDVFLTDLYFQTRKANTRLVRMSADVADKQGHVDLMDGIKIETTIYPVEEKTLEVVNPEKLKDDPIGLFPRTSFRWLDQDYRLPAKFAHQNKNVLVFCPSKADCDEGVKLAKKSFPAKIAISCYANKDVDTSQMNTPYIVFSTDIFQQSITLPNLDVVVDFRREWKPEAIIDFENDSYKYTNDLRLRSIDTYSYTQRKGRVGRTQNGTYYYPGSHDCVPPRKVSDETFALAMMKMIAYDIPVDITTIHDAHEKVNLQRMDCLRPTALTNHNKITTINTTLKNNKIKGNVYFDKNKIKSCLNMTGNDCIYQYLLPVVTDELIDKFYSSGYDKSCPFVLKNDYISYIKEHKIPKITEQQFKKMEELGVTLDSFKTRNKLKIMANPQLSENNAVVLTTSITTLAGIVAAAVGGYFLIDNVTCRRIVKNYTISSANVMCVAKYCVQENDKTEAQALSGNNFMVYLNDFIDTIKNSFYRFLVAIGLKKNRTPEEEALNQNFSKNGAHATAGAFWHMIKMKAIVAYHAVEASALGVGVLSLGSCIGATAFGVLFTRLTDILGPSVATIVACVLEATVTWIFGPVTAVATGIAAFLGFIVNGFFETRRTNLYTGEQSMATLAKCVISAGVLGIALPVGVSHFSVTAGQSAAITKALQTIPTNQSKLSSIGGGLTIVQQCYLLWVKWDTLSTNDMLAMGISDVLHLMNFGLIESITVGATLTGLLALRTIFDYFNREVRHNARSEDRERIYKEYLKTFDNIALGILSSAAYIANPASTITLALHLTIARCQGKEINMFDFFIKSAGVNPAIALCVEVAELILKAGNQNAGLATNNLNVIPMVVSSALSLASSISYFAQQGCPRWVLQVKNWIVTFFTKVKNFFVESFTKITKATGCNMINGMLEGLGIRSSKFTEQNSRFISMKLSPDCRHQLMDVLKNHRTHSLVSSGFCLKDRNMTYEVADHRELLKNLLSQDVTHVESIDIQQHWEMFRIPIASLQAHLGMASGSNKIQLSENLSLELFYDRSFTLGVVTLLTAKILMISAPNAENYTKGFIVVIGLSKKLSVKALENLKEKVQLFNYQEMVFNNDNITNLCSFFNLGKIAPLSGGLMSAFKRGVGMVSALGNLPELYYLFDAKFRIKAINNAINGDNDVRQNLPLVYHYFHLCMHNTISSEKKFVLDSYLHPSYNISSIHTNNEVVLDDNEFEIIWDRQGCCREISGATEYKFKSKNYVTDKESVMCTLLFEDRHCTSRAPVPLCLDNAYTTLEGKLTGYTNPTKHTEHVLNQLKVVCSRYGLVGMVDFMGTKTVNLAWGDEGAIKLTIEQDPEHPKGFRKFKVDILINGNKFSVNEVSIKNYQPDYIDAKIMATADEKEQFDADMIKYKFKKHQNYPEVHEFRAAFGTTELLFDKQQKRLYRSLALNEFNLDPMQALTRAIYTSQMSETVKSFVTQVKTDFGNAFKQNESMLGRIENLVCAPSVKAVGGNIDLKAVYESQEKERLRCMEEDEEFSFEDFNPDREINGKYSFLANFYACKIGPIYNWEWTTGSLAPKEKINPSDCFNKKHSLDSKGSRVDNSYWENVKTIDRFVLPPRDKMTLNDNVVASRAAYKMQQLYEADPTFFDDAQVILDPCCGYGGFEQFLSLAWRTSAPREMYVSSLLTEKHRTPDFERMTVEGSNARVISLMDLHGNSDGNIKDKNFNRRLINYFVQLKKEVDMIMIDIGEFKSTEKQQFEWWAKSDGKHLTTVEAISEMFCLLKEGKGRLLLKFTGAFTGGSQVLYPLLKHFKKWRAIKLPTTSHFSTEFYIECIGFSAKPKRKVREVEYFYASIVSELMDALYAADTIFCSRGRGRSAKQFSNWFETQEKGVVYKPLGEKSVLPVGYSFVDPITKEVTLWEPKWLQRLDKIRWYMRKTSGKALTFTSEKKIQMKNLCVVGSIKKKQQIVKEKRTSNALISQFMGKTFGLNASNSTYGHTQASQRFKEQSIKKRLDVDCGRLNEGVLTDLYKLMELSFTQYGRELRGTLDFATKEEVRKLVNNRGVGSSYDSYKNLIDFIDNTDNWYEQAMDLVSHWRAGGVTHTYFTVRHKAEPKEKKNVDEGKITEKRGVSQETLDEANDLPHRFIQFADIVSRLAHYVVLGRFLNAANDNKIYKGTINGIPPTHAGRVLRTAFDLNVKNPADRVINPGNNEHCDIYLDVIKPIETTDEPAALSIDFSSWDATVTLGERWIEAKAISSMFAKKHHSVIMNMFKDMAFAVCINDDGDMWLRSGQRGSGEPTTSSGNTWLVALNTARAISKTLGLTFEQVMETVAVCYANVNGKIKKYEITSIPQFSDGDDTVIFTSKQKAEIFKKKCQEIFAEANKIIRAGKEAGAHLHTEFNKVEFCSHTYEQVVVGPSAAKFGMSEMAQYKLAVSDPRYKIFFMQTKEVPNILSRMRLTLKYNTSTWDPTDTKPAGCVDVTRSKVCSYLLMYPHIRLVRYSGLSLLSVIGDGPTSYAELTKRYGTMHDLPDKSTFLGALKSLYGTSNLDDIGLRQYVRDSLSHKKLAYNVSLTYTSLPTNIRPVMAKMFKWVLDWETFDKRVLAYDSNYCKRFSEFLTLSPRGLHWASLNDYLKPKYSLGNIIWNSIMAFFNISQKPVNIMKKPKTGAQRRAIRYRA